MTEKRKIGIYSFTGCSGDQLIILECRAELFKMLERVEIKTFLMAQSNNKKGKLDIAFLEGSITTEKQQKELEEIRMHSKILVAIGTCACFGGIQAMESGEGGWEKRFQKVYGKNKNLVKRMKPFEAKPCDAFVKIDYYIPGCPIDKDQFLHSISRMLNGNTPYLYKFPVCTECKWRENECLLLKGILCLGPLTRAGCGAICPSHNLPCVGCWGPTETLNITSEYKLLKEKGYSSDEILNKFRKFGGTAILKHIKKLLEGEG